MNRGAFCCYGPRGGFKCQFHAILWLPRLPRVTCNPDDSYSSCHDRERFVSFIVEIEGYRARVERDREGMLHGRVLEMEDLVYFKAATMRLVESKFANALQLYFELCKQKGVEPKKPTPHSF